MAHQYHNAPPDFFRKASMGILAGWEAGSWFGYSDDVSTTEMPISPQPWEFVFPSSPTTVQISSTNAGDTSGGAGARSVLISGLLEDFTEKEELILLNGTTPVLGSVEFFRINSISVSAAGSFGYNVGTIWCAHSGAAVSGGEPTNDSLKLSVIAVGDSQSNCAWATVPANKHVHITSGLWTVGASFICRIAFLTRERGSNIFFRRGEIELKESTATFDFYRNFTEGTDVKVTASSALAGSSVSAYYNYLLEQVTNGQ